MFKIICLALLIVLLPAGDSFSTKMSWDAVESNQEEWPILGYVLYFKDVDEPTMYSKQVGLVTEFQTGDDFQLVKGRKYEFFVTSYNGKYESEKSEGVFWTEPSVPIPPDLLPVDTIVVPAKPTNVEVIDR